MPLTAPASPPVPASLTTTPFTARVERRILDFIRRNDILEPGETIVAAVSGGPDSTALLVLLSRLSPKLSLQLTVAHFDHRLRTRKEAAADLDFVRSLASTLGLPLVHAAAGVRAYASENHVSTEDAARRLRYAFLGEQAAALGASAVAVGHTLDDQAETVLLHLIRGAGLDGLAGMRPRSQWPFGTGPELARPMLGLRRADTERYCRELSLEPRGDPTNDSLAPTRNRIRHAVLPQLRELNPRIVEAIGRLSQSAAEDAAYLDDMARHYFSVDMAYTKGAVREYRSNLVNLDPALGNRWIRLAVERLAGTDAGLEATHIDAVREIAAKGRGQVVLPGGLRATANSRSVIFSRGEPTTARPIADTPLTVPGLTQAGGWQITAIPAQPSDNPHFAPKSWEAYLDADKAGTYLTVRSRRPGDRLRPLGLGGEKKLQDILVDAKVPALERDGVPIISGPRGIVWVVGHCLDESYALSRASRHALHLTVNRELTTEN
jgi:tRNA(Ile)-lysidine synthase